MTVLSTIAIILASAAVFAGLFFLAIDFFTKKKRKNITLITQKKHSIIKMVHDLPSEEVTLPKLYQLNLLYQALDKDDPMPFFYAIKARVLQKYALDIESVEVFIKEFDAQYARQNEYIKEWEPFRSAFAEEDMESKFIALLQKTVQEILKNDATEAEYFLRMIETSYVLNIFNRFSGKYSFLHKLRTAYDHYVE